MLSMLLPNIQKEMDEHPEKFGNASMEDMEKLLNSTIDFYENIYTTAYMQGMFDCVETVRELTGLNIHIGTEEDMKRVAMEEGIAFGGSVGIDLDELDTMGNA